MNEILAQNCLLSMKEENSFVKWMKEYYSKELIQPSDLPFIILGYHLSNDATKALLNKACEEKTLLNNICNQWTKNQFLDSLTLYLLIKPAKRYLDHSKKQHLFSEQQGFAISELLQHYSVSYPRKKSTVALRNTHVFLTFGLVNFMHFKPMLSALMTPLHLILGLSIGCTIAKLAYDRYNGVAQTYEKIFTQNKEKKKEFKSFSFLTEQIHDAIFLYQGLKLLKHVNQDKKLLAEQFSELENSYNILSKEEKEDFFKFFLEKEYLLNTSVEKQIACSNNKNKQNKNNKI